MAAKDRKIGRSRSGGRKIVAALTKRPPGRPRFEPKDWIKSVKLYESGKVNLVGLAKLLGYKTYQSASKFLVAHGYKPRPRGSWTHREIRWTDKKLAALVKAKLRSTGAKLAEKHGVSKGYIFMLLTKAKEKGISP